MKILQTKISNVTSYLLLVFTIASVSLSFYGQFSNLEFETLNNTSTELAPISNTILPDEVFVEESDTLPIEGVEASSSLESGIMNDVMLTPEVSEPVVE